MERLHHGWAIDAGVLAPNEFDEYVELCFKERGTSQRKNSSSECLQAGFRFQKLQDARIFILEIHRRGWSRVMRLKMTPRLLAELPLK